MIRLPRDALRRTTQGFGIPTDLIDTHGPAVGAIGVAVYVALVRYADPQTGACTLDIAQIARVLALAPSTVTTVLQRLAAVGLILDEAGEAETAGPGA